MKTKSTHRITSLVLAIVMLASVFTLPTFAEEMEPKKDPQIFATVDFEDAENESVEAPDGAEEDTYVGSTITATGLKNAHTYVTVAQDSLHGKYAILPFRGTTYVEDVGGRPTLKGTGNFGDALEIKHPGVSYEDYLGVNLEFDFYPSHKALEGEKDPIVDFGFRWINHDPANNKTAIANASFGTLNLKTGAFTTSAKVQEGAIGPALDTWNTVRIELDLARGLYSIYFNGSVYACFGTFGNGYDAANIVIPANTLTIAKMGENENAYSDDTAIADTDMTYIAVDNVKLYENADFSASTSEDIPDHAIFYDSYQARNPGMSPKAFGYPSVPKTAAVVQDSLNTDNLAVRMDITPYVSAEYFVWHSGNSFYTPVRPNEGYDDPDNPDAPPKYDIEGGVLTATVKINGEDVTFKGKIWGDDSNETNKTPKDDYRVLILEPIYDETAPAENEGASAPDAEPTPPVPVGWKEITQEQSTVGNKNGYYFFVTGAYRDAYQGGDNVSVGLNVKHPALQSSAQPTIDGKKNILLNVDYYFSLDAKGKIEVQIKGDFARKDDPAVTYKDKWMDLVVFNPQANSNSISLVKGSNTEIVCQNEAVVLKKGEWFRMTVVFNMETGWMDVYFNGEYCLTQKPADKQFKDKEGKGPNLSDLMLVSLRENQLNVGKVQRLDSHTKLGGYFLIDNVGFYTGAALRSDEYERSYQQNFDGLTAGTDLTKTEFGKEIPSSVVLASESTHATALKMTVGEKIENSDVANKLVLYRPNKGKQQTSDMYEVAKVYQKNGVDYVVLEDDYPDGAPAEVPADALRPEAAMPGRYTVNGLSGFKLATYAEYVNCWGKFEDGSVSDNINKDWRFGNPSISYMLRARLATDVEIFIPENAAGILTSQIYEGNGLDANGSKVEFKNKIIYSIDLETGNINLGDKVTAKNKLGTLNVGEWNNVSVYINLLTGMMELYVNNRYAGDGSFGMTEVAFYANSWIVAKVDAGQEKLGGYVMIDDARFFSITDEMITVDDSIENVSAVKFDGEVMSVGTKLFITDDVRCSCDPSDPAYHETDCGKYYEQKYDISAYEGMVNNAYSDNYEVAIRTDVPLGLRLTTRVNKALLAQLCEEYNGTLTYGTVIVPKRDITSTDGFTRTSLKRAGIKYADIRTNEFFTNEYLEQERGYVFNTEEEGVFAGSMVAMSEANLQIDFCAVGYVEILLENGDVIALYSNPVVVNVAELCAEYLDTMDNIPANIKEVLESFRYGRYPQKYYDEKGRLVPAYLLNPPKSAK